MTSTRLLSIQMIVHGFQHQHFFLAENFLPRYSFRFIWNCRFKCARSWNRKYLSVLVIGHQFVESYLNFFEVFLGIYSKTWVEMVVWRT